MQAHGVDRIIKGMESIVSSRYVSQSLLEKIIIKTINVGGK